MSISKSVRVYDLSPFPPERNVVQFVQYDDDAPGSWVNEVRLDLATWQHMGEPRQLTITIHPGDLLNPTPEQRASSGAPVLGAWHAEDRQR